MKLKCLVVSCLCAVVIWTAATPSVAADVPWPKDLPPVKWMKDQVPKAKVPEVRGDSYSALVPDTCDLGERARLFLEGYLTEITLKQPGYYHEVFNRGTFTQIPESLTLDIGSYLCGLPKYREVLPLLRIMTGSRKSLDIDRAWAEQLLKCIGPDGLYYVPRIGRPWDCYIGFGQKGNAYWWQMPDNVDFYAALPLGNGRLLGSIAVYYQMTGDEIWKKTGKGVVDRMNQLAIWNGKTAFFPKFVWLPGESLSPEQIKKERDAMYSAETTGETDKNTSLWQTWIITGLAQFYRATGYEPAKDLAYGLVQYLRDTKYVEDWKSHFHCITLGIHAMMELALVAGDKELAEYARKAYEVAKSTEHHIAIPEIGYYVNDKGRAGMEGCSIGDMTALAAKLCQLRMGDQYYEDLDRHVRNCLTAIQRTHPSHASSIFAKLAAEKKSVPAPLEYHQLADRLPERLVGSFSSSFFPNDLFASTYFDTCCSGNCARALYYAWECILSGDENEIKVNLLMNRASQWADVESYLPYQGCVDIKVKKPSKQLKVRLNKWIDRERVICEMDGEKLPYTMQGNYLVLGPVKKGQWVRLQFPITEESKELKSFDHQYTAIFRGNECVDIEPKGPYYPLFLRDHYRTSEPRFIEVQRFVSDTIIDY